MGNMPTLKKTDIVRHYLRILKLIFINHTFKTLNILIKKIRGLCWKIMHIKPPGNNIVLEEYIYNYNFIPPEKLVSILYLKRAYL